MCTPKLPKHGDRRISGNNMRKPLFATAATTHTHTCTRTPRKRGKYCECIATWRPPDVAPVPICFNYDAHAKSEIARPIRCRLIALLLLIRYAMVWPWLLTLNICSILAVPWSNSVPNVSEIEQSAAELLRFEYLTLWPWTRITCCAMLRIVCTKFKLSQAITSRNVTIFWG